MILFIELTNLGNSDKVLQQVELFITLESITMNLYRMVRGNNPGKIKTQITT